MITYFGRFTYKGIHYQGALVDAQFLFVSRGHESINLCDEFIDMNLELQIEILSSIYTNLTIAHLLHFLLSLPNIFRIPFVVALILFAYAISGVVESIVGIFL